MWVASGQDRRDADGAVQKCDVEYDRFQVEQPLIEMISRMITSFQTQDVCRHLSVHGRLADACRSR